MFTITTHATNVTRYDLRDSCDRLDLRDPIKRLLNIEIQDK